MCFTWLQRNLKFCSRANRLTETAGKKKPAHLLIALPYRLFSHIFQKRAFTDPTTGKFAAFNAELSQPLTFPQVLLLGFAPHAVDPRHGLHVTLVNGRWVQNGLRRPSQADRQTCSAHQDTCHTWCMCTAQRRTNRHKRVDKAPTVSIFTDLLVFGLTTKWRFEIVLHDYVHFGRLQSHLPALGVEVQIRSGSLPGGQEPCKRRGKLIDDLMFFI